MLLFGRPSRFHAHGLNKVLGHAAHPEGIHLTEFELGLCMSRP